MELVVDVGLDPSTGKRRQTRRRYRTVTEALDAYSEFRKQASEGTYVARSPDTVREVVTTWLASRHGLRATTRAGYETALRPLLGAYGELPLRQLSKRHIVDLIDALTHGRLIRSNGRACRPWKARTVNLFLVALRQVLDDAFRQGLVARNVGALVDRLPQTKTPLETFTPEEVKKLLSAVRTDRLEHAWHLALYGLRRGEVAGLMWGDVDFGSNRLTIRTTRVSVDGHASASTPKTRSGRRELPMTPDLVAVLRRAQQRQAGERELVGRSWVESGHVVTNDIGAALHPDTLSAKWEKVIATAKVRRIRLHDARHTCGTLLHLQGVPIAVISAWLGHADASFTMRTYVHSQEHALNDAADALRLAM